MYKNILMDGLIGAGKTTLGQSLVHDCDAELSKELGFDNDTLKEKVKTYYEKTPYFQKDYDAKKHTLTQELSTYSFDLQNEMMGYHACNTLKCNMINKAFDRTLILDRGVFSVFVFTGVQYALNILSKDDTVRIIKAYETLCRQHDSIDLFIYLDNDIDACLDNVKTRQRGGEVNIKLQYMEVLKKVQKEVFLPYMIDYQETELLIVNSKDLGGKRLEDTDKFKYTGDGYKRILYAINNIKAHKNTKVKPLDVDWYLGAMDKICK